MTLVAIRSLGKRYGEATALAGVDLDIPADGRTAIVGASGSGKSTLLRLIAGFEPPDAGSIVFAGDTLADDATFVPAHRRAIGYVSQDGALFPHLSVADNVAFALPRGDRTRAARVAELLDLVQLDRALATRRPHELSGGQQQRVALARTLAVRPRLVLLDEPFSALDVGLRESLRDTVASVLADARVSTVLVTHDQEEALSFATHLAVLRDGRLVQAGPPQDLYRAPRDPGIAAFLGDAIVLRADIADGWANCILGRVATTVPVAKSSATILIRPEQLRLAPPAGETHPLAIVTHVAFGGPTSTIRLQWVDGAAATSNASFTVRAEGAPPLVGDMLAISVRGPVHVFD